MQHWFIDLYDRFSEGHSKSRAIALSFMVVTLAACLSLEGSGRLSLILFLARFVFFVMMTFVLVSFRTTRMWSRTDYLTGIENRRGFSERAGAELQRSGRHRRPVTLAYLDIDNLKAVNDRFGHNTGDQLLRVVADTLRANLRREDVLSRQGGDEFAILFVETGGAAAEVVLNRIHSALLTAGLEHDWPVTFSIGAVTYEGAPPAVEVLVQRADELMYLAKRTRNKTVLYVETDSSEAISALPVLDGFQIPPSKPKTSPIVQPH
jgi:diguanylate cyclase (GGDEF)-like protein